MGIVVFQRQPGEFLVHGLAQVVHGALAHPSHHIVLGIPQHRSGNIDANQQHEDSDQNGEVHSAAALQQRLCAPDDLVGGTAHDLGAQRRGHRCGAGQQDDGDHADPVRAHEPQ